MRRAQEKKYTVSFIDHGHCFGGPDWDFKTLQPLQRFGFETLTNQTKITSLLDQNKIDFWCPKSLRLSETHCIKLLPKFPRVGISVMVGRSLSGMLDRLLEGTDGFLKANKTVIQPEKSVANSTRQETECLVAVVRYVPDPTRIDSVCIAVLLVELGSFPNVLVKRLSHWEKVLGLDSQADILVLISTIEEIASCCQSDPQFLEKAQGWENSIQVSPLLSISTSEPEQELEKIFLQYCEDHT